MIKTIRAQSKYLLGGLFVLLSASLLIFFNLPQFESQMQSSDFGKIDGKTVTTEDFRLARQGTEQSVRLTEGHDISSQNEVWNQMSWQRLILLSEARKLGILVADSEVVDFIRNMPVFQKDGKFDGEALQWFQNNYLPNQNVSFDRFEQIIREDIEIAKVQDAILSPVHVSDAEVKKTILEYFGNIKVNVIRWNKSDFLKDIKVSPTAIGKELQDHGSNPDYRTLERRRVALVFFPLTPGESKLPEAEKAKAKRAQGEKATDFAATVLDKISNQPDAWESVVKERGLTSVETDFFNKNEAPKELPPSPNFNRAAFLLNKDVPISEAVEVDNGYVVLRLLDIQPSQLRPLVEIESAVEQNVRSQAASEALRKSATEAELGLKSAIASGKDFLTAARQLKLTVESPAPFALFKLPPDLKDSESIAQAARTLQPGQISSLLPVANGALLVELVSRVDSGNKLEDLMRPQLESKLLQERREQFMEDWFHLRLQSPDIVLPLALQQK